MEWYFIFETEDGEQYAVCEASRNLAINTLEEVIGYDVEFELIDEFPANEFGDNLIDAMGLDVL